MSCSNLLKMGPSLVILSHFFLGIHSIHSDLFTLLTLLIFTRPSIFDFGTPWNEILKILHSDPQAVNCALSSSSGYLLARKVKVPLQVFLGLFLGFAVAD